MLGAAAVAAASTSSGSAKLIAKDTGDSRFPANAWHQRIKRITQINFNERDPENFDVEAWANYLASTKAQATFLSVTNAIAFYPTEIPDFPPSRYLNGRDIFGECARAAKARGIRIMGRMSPDMAHADLAEKHPDWFRRDADASLVQRGEEMAGFSVGSAFAPTCQFTTYFSEFVP